MSTLLMAPLLLTIAFGAPRGGACMQADLEKNGGACTRSDVDTTRVTELPSLSFSTAAVGAPMPELPSDAARLPALTLEPRRGVIGPDRGPTEESGSVLRNLPFVTGGVIGFQVASLFVISRLPADATGWGEGSFEDIPETNLKGPKWDNDPWLWNYVGHPLAGAEYYLLARNRNAEWWAALLYAAALSCFWEFFTEAYYERPSGQDLMVTPFGGALLGEARWQAKRALLGPKGRSRKAWRTALAIVLDPIDALTGGL